jgi:hypothetical protein
MYIRIFAREHKNLKRAPCLANPQPEDKNERASALIARAALPVGVYIVICIFFFALYLLAVLSVVLLVTSIKSGLGHLHKPVSQTQ